MCVFVPATKQRPLIEPNTLRIKLTHVLSPFTLLPKIEQQCVCVCLCVCVFVCVCDADPTDRCSQSFRAQRAPHPV